MGAGLVLLPETVVVCAISGRGIARAEAQISDTQRREKRVNISTFRQKPNQCIILQGLEPGLHQLAQYQQFSMKKMTRIGNNNNGHINRASPSHDLLKRHHVIILAVNDERIVWGAGGLVIETQSR
jgi:hypothetical protein